MNRDRLKALSDKEAFDEETLSELYRAVSTGRLIAFLGSGISAPYGAMNWNQFFSRVRDEASERIKQAQVVARHKRPYLYARLQDIAQQMEELDSIAPDDPVRMIALLEFYQLAFETADESMGSRPKKGSQPDAFKEFIADLFSSDLAYAKRLLSERLLFAASSIFHDKHELACASQFFEPPFPPSDKASALFLDFLLLDIHHHDTSPPGSEDAPGGSRPKRGYDFGDDEVPELDFNLFYSARTIECLRTGLAAVEGRGRSEQHAVRERHRAELNAVFVTVLKDCDELATRLGTSNKGAALSNRGHGDERSVPLPPDRRSVLAALLGSVAAFIAVWGSKEEAQAFWHELRRLLGSCTRKIATSPSTARKFTSTTGELRPLRDPILELHDGLEIWRFLTTNYDREVERLLEHLNHARGTLARRDDVPAMPAPLFIKEGGRYESRGYLGELSTSDALTDHTIGGLIALATDSRKSGARIIHLHGRADAAETIVATESDYQNVYLRDGEAGEALEAAQHVIFSGNPVIFIGSGMREQDLQRPLREFVSRMPGSQRTLFALMPADQPPGKRLATKVENYLRYGVRTIFYGEKGAASPLKQNPQAIGVLEEGLEAICTALRELRSACSLDEFPSEPSDQRAQLDLVIQRMTTATDVLFSDRLLGEDRMDDEAWQALRSAFSAHRQTFDTPGDRLNVSALRATLRAFLDYTDQLRGRLISGALVKAIHDLITKRQRWWKNVLDSPIERITPPLCLVGSDERQMRIYLRQPLIIRRSIPSDACEAAHAFLNALRRGAHKSECRVFLCEAEHGVGKGNQFYALKQLILQQPDTSISTGIHCYRYALILNLGHSIEFSSSVIATANLLKRMAEDIADFPNRAMLLDDDKNEFLRANGHLELIEKLLDGLRSVRTPYNSKRGVILIGAFDRLVESPGRYRSQEVRSFVQLLAQASGDEIPLDIIFVSRNVSHHDRLFSYDLGRSDPVEGLVFDKPHEKNKADRVLKRRTASAQGSPDGLPLRITYQSTMDAKTPLGLPMAKVGSWLETQGRSWFGPSPVVLRIPAHGGTKDEDCEGRPDKLRRVTALLRDKAYSRFIVERAYTHLNDPGGNGQAAERWADKLSLELEASSESLYGDRVTRAVLAAYRVDPRNSGTLDRNSRIDFIILQHLTFFGFPVEGHVLLHAPAIREHLQQAVESDRKFAPESDQSPPTDMLLAASVGLLEESLRRLIDRGLVSVMDDALPDYRGTVLEGNDLPMSVKAALRGKDNYPSAKKLSKLKRGFRFALHPQLRRFLLKNTAVNTPDTEFVNTFVFTLYATQPTDVSLLNPDVQSVADGVIDQLVQPWRTFPVSSGRYENLAGQALEDAVGDPGRYFYEAKTKEGLIARASADMPACYRAAYGILRQLRPFSVLARTQVDGSPGAAGSLYEATDRRLRDLLRAVQSSQEARTRLQKVLPAKDGTVSGYGFLADWEEFERHVHTLGPLREPTQPLYAHELAWLWNERGVLALAQGRLHDAAPYLSHARQLLGKHEGESGRSTTIRIDINLATVWIERGHLRRAERLLTQSRESLEAIFRRTSPAEMMEDVLSTGPLCIGYGGLIKHLGGDHVGAREDYHNALERLRELDRNRATATFSRFLADLLTAQGDTDEAERVIYSAQEAATGLQQLDLVHGVYLSKVKLLLRKTSDRVPADAFREIDELLQTVHLYADRMGLYRLKSEALALEARFRLRQSDVKQARRAAMESVSIATYHGMTLRRLTAMTILADVFSKAGSDEACRDMLKQAQEVGQRIGYNRLVRAAFDARRRTS